MRTLPGVDVSRETIEKLEAYLALVEKWTRKINLISKNSIPFLWDRHVADSAQVFDLVEPPAHWLDIGSGGGFPGVVIAVLLSEKSPESRITMIESDQRKCAFLRTALRELDVPGTVVADRIENVERQAADVLSARALADLDQLLGFAELHLVKNGTALLPKGATWQTEVEEARKTWQFDCEAINSRTQAEAAILKIKDIQRV